MSSLVRIMPWRWMGDKLLFTPMMVQFTYAHVHRVALMGYYRIGLEFYPNVQIQLWFHCSLILDHCTVRSPGLIIHRKTFCCPEYTSEYFGILWSTVLPLGKTANSAQIGSLPCRQRKPINCYVYRISWSHIIRPAYSKYITNIISIALNHFCFLLFVLEPDDQQICVRKSENDVLSEYIIHTYVYDTEYTSLIINFSFNQFRLLGRIFVLSTVARWPAYCWRWCQRIKGCELPHLATHMCVWGRKFPYVCVFSQNCLISMDVQQSRLCRRQELFYGQSHQRSQPRHQPDVTYNQVVTILLIWHQQCKIIIVRRGVYMLTDARILLFWSYIACDKFALHRKYRDLDNL